MTYETSKSTAEQLIEQYLTYREVNQGKSSTTSDKYRLYLSRLVEYCGKASVDPLTIDHEQLVTFTGVYAFKEMNMGPMSRRAIVAAVRGFYKWLHKHGVTQANLADRIEYPKKLQRLPLPIPMDAAEKIMWAPDLTTFTGIRDAAILGLLIGTGMRISGLVALNMSSLVWTQRDGRELLDVRVIEKGNKERIVPVPDQARLLIRAYLGHAHLETVDRHISIDDQVLFVSTRNHSIDEGERYGENIRLQRGSIDYMIKRYGEQVGIPPQYLHAHAFRHLFGMAMAEKDIDIQRIKALMGHANVETTEIYTHLAQSKLRESIDRASPLSDIKTPVSDLSRVLKKAGKQEDSIDE